MQACELCGKEAELTEFILDPKEAGSCLICPACEDALIETDNPNYWRCLQDAVWSENRAVLVLAYRTLKSIENQDWTTDLLDKLYLDDETQDLADTLPTIHKDGNGVVLLAGDTVSLSKDLTVKGAGFTAKRGTVVKNIRLVDNNAQQIEGKVNGTLIVILTQFTKKI
jgi:protein PhnA